MVSETKAISDTYLHKHESLIPLKLISSINSDNIRKYQSGNNISSKERIHNYQTFSNNYLINTHFPIANIQQGNMILIYVTMFYPPENTDMSFV
jgi:hypothetical protein